MLHYQNQVRSLWATYFLGIPIEGFCSKVTVSRETSVHIRCRKPGDVIILNGHRRNQTYLFIDLKSLLKSEKITPDY